MKYLLSTTFTTSLLLAFASIFLSFQLTLVNCSPQPQVAVPSGIQLPKDLLGQVIPTSNPYIPHRPENAPPSPSASSSNAPTSKTAYDFVARDFFIIIGGILGFIGLIILALMIWRLIKGDPDLTKQWEKEQEDLARRSSEGVAKHKKKWFRRKQALSKEEREKEELKLKFESD